MTAARRRAINEVLDQFVPAAVERHNPAAAFGLVTPAFRAGVTRAEWNGGNLPALPFDTRDKQFHGWTLSYNHPREMSVDVLLQPSAKEGLGAIAFTVVFRMIGGRWLIDSFVPAASFAPEKKSPRILAQPDFQPNMITGATHKSRLNAQWLLVPAALLALIVLVPLGLVVMNVVRGRRAMRTYRSLYERSPGV